MDILLPQTKLINKLKERPKGSFSLLCWLEQNFQVKWKNIEGNPADNSQLVDYIKQLIDEHNG